MKKLGIWYRFVEKGTSTVHTADAAHVSGIALHKISKNLIAQTNDGRYAALVIPGDTRLEYKEAAKTLAAKNVRLVPFNEAHLISGYPPGGTPAIGFKKKVDVVVDEEMTRLETFYCGGGSTKMLLELKSVDVLRLNHAIVSKISTRSKTEKQ